MATKKASGKDQSPSAKSQDLNGSAASRSENSNSRPGMAAPDPAVHQQALQAYEQALKLMQAQKFDKAKPMFDKVIASGVKELADRAKVHLAICDQQMARTQNQFSSVEEQFDYAISLMNMGDFVTAREHLEGLTGQNPRLDFVWYGLAALESLTGHTHESLQHLSTAIKLNPQVRYQARNDSDFKNMADDPRFTELLYPEGATA